MPDDLIQRIISSIAETQHIPPERISVDSTFEELGIDSLDGINILFALENEFDIDIPDEAAQNIGSIGEMVEGVRKLISGDTEASEASSQA